MNNNVNGYPSNGANDSRIPSYPTPPNIQGGQPPVYTQQQPVYQQPPVYQPPNYYAQYAPIGQQGVSGGGYVIQKPDYAVAAENTLGSMNIGLLTVFSILFGWFCARSVWIWQTGIGMTVMGAAFYLIYLPFIMFRQKKKVSLGAALLFLPQIALLGSFAVWSNPLPKAIGLLLSLAIAMVQTTLIAGCTAGKPFSYELLADACSTFIAYPFMNLVTTFKTVLGLNKDKSAKKGGTGSKIGLGLVLSIPVVLLLIILFANADSMFAMWIDMIVKALNINLGRVLLDVILIMITMLYVMPLVVTLRSGYHKEYEHKDYNRPIDAVIITTVLFAASVVYLVFVAVQFRYLFIGVPKELTYAEYCRRGFGELVFVIVLTTAVIITVCLLTKQNESGRLPAYTKAALLLISACDCVMIVSAVRRVVIYVDGYGMTVARFNAAVLILLMAACVVITALKILFEKLKVSAMAGAVLIVVLTGYACFNMDGFIAQYNVNRYLNHPTEKKIDMHYLTYDLSTGAIPALEQLMEEAPDSKVRLHAKYAIAMIADNNDLFVGDEYHIGRWSWDRQRAVDILEAHNITEKTVDEYYRSDRYYYDYDDEDDYEEEDTVSQL